MRTPKPGLAIALAVAAVALAVVAARWEAVATADERAADPLTVSAAAASPPSTVTAAIVTTDPASLRAAPTADIQRQLAAALDSIGRSAPTPTTPPPGASTSSATSAWPAPTQPPAPADAPPNAQPTNVDVRGQAALASITYPWQTRLPGWQIRFHPGIDGAYGYTLTDESIIDIYVRDGQSDQLLAHVIAHEIGHAVDVTLNDSADRDRWQAARGLDAQWWPDSRASDFATGAGDFAECFAAWQVGTASFRSQLGDAPTDDHLAVVADLSAG